MTPVAERQRVCDPFTTRLPCGTSYVQVLGLVTEAMAEGNAEALAALENFVDVCRSKTPLGRSAG